MNRALRLLTLAAATALALTAAAAPASLPAGAGLDDYLAWARQHSPRLAGHAAQIDVLDARARRAGALPGLKLAWGEMIVPVETRVGPQQRMLSVSQSLPWFGTLSARAGAVVAEAAAARSRLDAATAEVEREVRAAWYELAHLQGQEALVAADLDLARQAEAFARARYESGDGPYGALLMAQMAVGRLDVRLAGLRDRLPSATAQLNAAAGLPADLAGPPAPTLPDLAQAALPGRETLARALIQVNPSLAALAHSAAGRRSDLVAAGKGAYPDLTVGLDYVMTGAAAMPGVEDSGKDPVIARIAVSLPLWGGQAAAEKQASAGLLRAANETLADARLRLTARLDQLLFAWREAGRNVELYGVTLLPRARQNLDVVTAGYQSGQVPFDRLLEVRQELLGLELAHLRARADRALALNDLGALLNAAPADLAAGRVPAAVTGNESDQP